MKEQIEEMARDLENHTCMSQFQAEIASRMLYQLGYRKQSEGEWILKWKSPIPQYEPSEYQCSNCGFRRTVKHKFCPNCGAKMKGATDERAE